MLTPMPPPAPSKGPPRSSGAPVSSLSSSAPTAAALSTPFVRPFVSSEEEKSAQSPRASSLKLHRSPSLKTRAAATTTASAAAASSPTVTFDEVDDVLTDGDDANDHLSSPRIRGGRQLTQDSTQQSRAPQMDQPAALAPYQLSRTLLHTNAATSSGAEKPSGSSSSAPLSSASALRPWYLNIQEKSLAASGRTHRRTRLLHEQMVLTRNWGRQVREIVANNEAASAQRSKEETDEIQRLNSELQRTQELASLRLEAIAAIPDLELRARAKRARAKQLVVKDHPQLRAMDASKSALWEGVWSRGLQRVQRVKEEFCRSWEAVNFYGNTLQRRAQDLIAQSSTHSMQQIALLRKQIPKELTKPQVGMQIGMASDLATAGSAQQPAAAGAPARTPSVFANTPGIGIHAAGQAAGGLNTTAAAAATAAASSAAAVADPDESPSDYRFHPSGSAGDAENGISLRLPTSVSGESQSSGIDHITGAFDPNLAATQNAHALAASSPSAAASAASVGKDRNYTANRSHLALIHSNMTLLHTAAPALNPSWVTLSCNGAPKLLPRSAEQLASSPGYTRIYDELRTDLEGLQHREHVLDLLEQALHNYEQVHQINVEPVVAARNKPATDAANKGTKGNIFTEGFGAKPKQQQQQPNPVSVDDDVPPPFPEPLDPVATARLIQSRAGALLLELECANFIAELDAFRMTFLGNAQFATFLNPTQRDSALLTSALLSLPMLKALANAMLARMADRSRFFSRYYLEVHAHSARDSWFAGFVLPPFTSAEMQARDRESGAASASFGKEETAAATAQPLSVLDVDLYSTTQTTMCLHSDGSTFVSGHSRRVLPPLSSATVVGFVIDLLHGFVCYTSDGLQPHTIFGLGAEMYTPEEQRAQASIICTGRLRPVFGVLGPRVKLVQTSSQGGRGGGVREGDRERARLALAMGLDPSDSGSTVAAGLKQPQKARHALTAHSSLQTDESEAAGTIFAREGDSSTTAASAVFSSTAAPSHAAAHPSTPHTPSAASSGDGLLGWFLPKLSVNLGEFEFLYAPRGNNMGWTAATLGRRGFSISSMQQWASNNGTASAAAVDKSGGYNLGLGSCLAINTAAAPKHDEIDGSSSGDSSLIAAFQAHQANKAQQQALKLKQAAAASKAAASGGVTAATERAGAAAFAIKSASPLSAPALAAVAAPNSSSSSAAAAAGVAAPIASIDSALADYKHRQSALAFATLDAHRAALVARPTPAEHQKELEDQRASFLASLSKAAAGRLVSWSHFPPHSLRVQQAVLKVQRIARRYIGFRARRALWSRLSKYALRIQKAWRAHRTRKLARFLKAVLPIQRVWRGFKARRLVVLLRKYNLSFSAATAAAVRIQSFIRMLFARKRTLLLAMVVQQKIEQIRGLVIFVQRMWRRRIQKRQQMSSKSMLASVLIFQARIRGIRLRRMLAAIDPNAAKQLRVIATNVGVKQKRYAAVCTIQRVYRGYLARKFVQSKRAVLERDAGRLRDAWRAFQLRQQIDRMFRGTDASHLKTFFEALGYFPPLAQQQMQIS